MNKTLRELFEFNRSQQRGIILLIFLILLAIVIPMFIEFSKPDNDKEFEKFANDINRFEKEIAENKDSASYKEIDFNTLAYAKVKQTLKPFPFNPNNLSVEDWKRIGLTDKQIKVIKNFETKGGKFYTKEDVKKMYSISASEYAILEPYIVIPENIQPKNTTASAVAKKDFLMIELNSADTTELQKLNGIGAAFSKRIVKYRDALGGFSNINQLSEVYGLSNETFQKVNAHVQVNFALIKRMDINQATLNDLKKHPYIKYPLAKAIIDRRTAKGKYTSIEQLKEIPEINAEIFAKISPYLTIN